MHAARMADVEVVRALRVGWRNLSLRKFNVIESV